MIYYLQATITGKLVLSDHDSFDPHYLAATVIASNLDEIKEKLEANGFHVTVEVNDTTDATTDE